jgi:15-cis-phytoene synthase
MSDRAELVAFAQGSIARGSKSFGLASKLFDTRTRERAWLLYAWCRACDDIADGQDHGGALTMPTEAEELVRAGEVRRLTDLAYAGQPTGNPAFDCLAALHAECPLPRRFIDALLEGFDRDARGWRPRSEADLFSYCYNVAGAVGCMMAIIMGVDPADDDTLDRACDLGIAFQLANIARDVAEDEAASRCYLPEEWLVEMDMPPGQHMHPAFRPRLAVMTKWLAEFVQMYEASAQIGAARLPFRSRWAVLSAAGIYGGIAREVRARGEHAWDHRVSTSKRTKAAEVGRGLIEAVRPRATGRDARRRLDLWTRPR